MLIYGTDGREVKVDVYKRQLSDRVKWLLLARMIPLVENNFNLCELGPRSTGKSHIYKEISPNSILVSGGQTTVANLFYNMASKTVGLVGMWDCVAFDEEMCIRDSAKGGEQRRWYGNIDTVVAWSHEAINHYKRDPISRCV